jgi:hypothetical protein
MGDSSASHDAGVPECPLLRSLSGQDRTSKEFYVGFFVGPLSTSMVWYAAVPAIRGKSWAAPWFSRVPDRRVWWVLVSILPLTSRGRNAPYDSGRVVDSFCSFSSSGVAGLPSKRTSESPNDSWESSARPAALRIVVIGVRTGRLHSRASRRGPENRLRAFDQSPRFSDCVLKPDLALKCRARRTELDAPGLITNNTIRGDSTPGLERLN